jgi:VanZ family protein
MKTIKDAKVRHTWLFNIMIMYVNLKEMIQSFKASRREKVVDIFDSLKLDKCMDYILLVLLLPTW